MANPLSQQKIVRPGLAAKGDLSSLQRAVGTAEGASGGRPPIHLWNPPDCGDIDMRIARDGTWFYQGTPIGRPAMVRLFASIMRLEGTRHVLVTPVEKVGITVEDAPFIAVDFDVEGEGQAQRLIFTTNVGDVVELGPRHALSIDLSPEVEPHPLIEVRDGLMALIDRKSFYRLVALGQHHGDGEGNQVFGVWSCGVFFALARSADLPEEGQAPRSGG